MKFDYDLSAAPVLLPVNDGIYLLKVISSKEKTNEKGNQDIQFEFQILEPNPVEVDKKRVETIYYHYYISKEDPLTSLGFLVPLWEACGKLVAGAASFDTQDIYGCIFGAEIQKQAGTPQYPNPKNVIRKYFSQNNCPPPMVKDVEVATT